MLSNATLIITTDLSHSFCEGTLYVVRTFGTQKGEKLEEDSPSINKLVCADSDGSGDGEAPAGGGEASCVVGWLPVAGYRGSVRSSNGAAILSYCSNLQELYKTVRSLTW